MAFNGSVEVRTSKTGQQLLGNEEQESKYVFYICKMK